MAKHFIDAVHRMHAKLEAAQGPQGQAATVQAAVATMHPIVLNIVQKNNVQLARTFRNNPALLRGR